jgi:terminase small subunit / prophage DNA-packing protein
MASTEEAAEHLFMSPQRFQQLQKAGVIPRFPPMEVDVDICREAYIEHLREGASGRQRPGKPQRGRLDLEQEKAKVAARTAEKLDIELKRLRGSVVDAGEIRAALAATTVVVKDRLLSVPMAAADRALEAAPGGAKAIAEVYDRAIRAALEALAAEKVVPARVQ